jgi:hypothetical protein
MLENFLANRLSHTQEVTNESEWQHVSLKESPADMVSHGLEPNESKNWILWWNGPL